MRLSLFLLLHSPLCARKQTERTNSSTEKRIKSLTFSCLSAPFQLLSVFKPHQTSPHGSLLLSRRNMSLWYYFTRQWVPENTSNGQISSGEKGWLPSKHNLLVNHLPPSMVLISQNKSRWLIVTSIFLSLAHSMYPGHEHLILRSPEVCDCRFSKEKTDEPKGLSSYRKSKAHEVTGDFVIGGHPHVYRWTLRKQLFSAFQRTVDTQDSKEKQFSCGVCWSNKESDD